MQTSSAVKKKRILRFLTIAIMIFFSLLIFILALSYKNDITPEVAIKFFVIIPLLGIGVYLLYRKQSKMIDRTDHFEDLVIKKLSNINNKDN